MARKAIVAMVLVLLPVLGCSHTRTQYKGGPETWLSSNTAAPHQVSARTLDNLREVDLETQYKSDAAGTRLALAQQFQVQPRRDWAYALAEMAFVQGQDAETRRRGDAVELYYCALRYAYAFLFAGEIKEPLNALDPRTRLACDLYNASLFRLIALAKKSGLFDPQRRFVAPLANGSLDLPVVVRGFPWGASEIDKLEPVELSDRSELGRDIRNYGLGVPMVGLRIKPANCPPADLLLTPRHPFAVTVVMRPDIHDLFAAEKNPRAASRTTSTAAADLHSQLQQNSVKRVPAGEDGGPGKLNLAPNEPGVHLGPAVELLDPLSIPNVTINGRSVAIEAELSSPLVYGLRQTPRRFIELVGFLDPGRAAKSQGLVMLQPYQKGKIPVIFVHGLLSDPLTWTEMFNELGADPTIRDRYQFWAFFYPTGDPFLVSAAALRRNLAEARENCDPDHKDPALEQIVLVGHSMGGLLSKLQATSSGEKFWRTISQKPLDAIKTAAETREKIRRVFYFEPQPYIRRIVCIGTPNRGSDYSLALVGRIFSRLVHAPRMILGIQRQLVKDNPGAFLPLFAGRFPTSIDMLAPSNPVLQVMYPLESPPRVKLHSIIGNSINMGRDGPGDGFVTVASAHLPTATSEILIPEIHTKLHQHPRAVLEVKRILREHSAEFSSGVGGNRLIPASATLPVEKPAAATPK